MERWDGRRRGAPPPDPRPIAEIVPARAVLTELARGFLISQAADPERAKRFAASFLREQQGPPVPTRVIPFRFVPAARRGVDAALRDGDAPGSL